MSFGAGAMKFRKDKRCTAWICSDPDVAKEYEESEMCGFTFTDDAYLALFELISVPMMWNIFPVQIQICRYCL